MNPDEFRASITTYGHRVRFAGTLREDFSRCPNDLNKLFSVKSEIGTCIVVDLKASGALLRDRAGKPLICITRVERMD
jgi:hypothetical protein